MWFHVLIILIFAIIFKASSDGTSILSIADNSNFSMADHILQATDYDSGTTNVVYGSEGIITCDIKSSVPINIYWYYVDETTGRISQIVSSDKYWISTNGTELRIKKMDLDKVGKYICTAAYGQKVRIVLTAPEITGKTETRAIKGSNVLIDCKIIKGLPKPKITWEYMDQTVSKFTHIPSSGNVLRLSDVADKNAGRYKCVAENIAGKDEHVTRLVIESPPRIISKSSVVFEGFEGDIALKIPCDVVGIPQPVNTWKTNGNVITPNEKYSIENGALIIRNLTEEDSTSYTCEAKNYIGSVNAKFEARIKTAPRITGKTEIRSIRGSNVVIECNIIKGFPKPNITWEYMDHTVGKFAPIPSSGNVLRLSGVVDKNAGRYKCVAENTVGNDEHVTTLVVESLPRIISKSSRVFEGFEGDIALKIPCDVVGIPQPVNTWKRNGNVITPNEKYSIENGTLIIRNLTGEDSTSYTCEAKNYIGSVNATFKARVKTVPRITGKFEIRSISGSNVVIECNVEGEPKPTITWQFMDNSSSKFLPIPGSDKVLNFPRVENKHAGRYKCVAKNEAGSNEHIITLEVQDIPKIASSVSTIYQGTEGDALLRIPCVAGGIPKPRITWKLNGHVINPSVKYSFEDGTLIIRDPKVSDTNSYTCEAKNEVGAVSATFRTYIRQLPKLSGYASKNVRLGTPTSIECIIVKGEPKPKITWQFMGKSASKYVPIAGSENTLRISSAKKRHAGGYKCVAQNNLGSDEHVTTLIVEFPPEIIKNSTTVEGIEGDLALRIPCDVVGIPKPVITWKFKGATITPDSKYTIEDGALVIMTPTGKDSSLYTCEAKNYISTASTTFRATVERLPTNFGTKHFVYLLEGETKKLKCDAYSSASQSVKWFITKDAGIKEPYIQIANASITHDDGNYTCRVSDKHGNIQTHTYAVDVGSAPEFLSELYSLNNWRGDISDIKHNCDIRGNAKPKPVVEWRLNGKVLTDLNSAGPGHYTCNISNVHGSVQRRFDVNSSACLITRNLGNAHMQYMPLVLDDKGFWHKLKNTEHYTVVEQEHKIKLSCTSQKATSNRFKKFPKKSTLEAFCHKEDSFLVEGKIYKLSDLQCTNRSQPFVIRNKVKCSTETSELMRVGSNVPGFLEAYEVCFDTEKNMPLYTRIIMTETNNNGLSAGYDWYTYPGIYNKKTERGFTCKDTMSSCCYSKSQLVNAIDFNDGPAKKSTFIDPLNVIPVWLPCDTSKPSWESINKMVRSQLPLYEDIVTWSGTHTLQEKNGAIIPRYLWKVVRLDEDEAVAIVHVNDPKPVEKDIKCKTQDICDKYEDWFISSDKYTYCCSLPDFFESFDIHGTDIGESMDAVLGKIEKST